MQSQILNYSVTTHDDGTFRLDAEHYQEKFIRNQEKLLRFGSMPLLNFISQPVMTGHTPSMKIETYYGGDIGFVKTDNLREFKIAGEYTHYLSTSGDEILKRSSLKNGDLIITIIGATHKIVGRAALVRKEDLPANINQNIALIRLKESYSPEFLSAYLNCEIGKLAVWYLSRQTEQVNLNCREVEKVLVPNASPVFVQHIEDAYKNAVICEHKAREALDEAQEQLLNELGLSDWQPKHELSFIKNFSNVEKYDRFDAEFYQPKYEVIEEAIKNYPGGYSIIGKQFKQNKSTFSIDEEKNYQYVEIGSVNISNGEISPKEVLGSELPANAKRILNKNDVIISKVRTYRGAMTIVEESGYIGSGAFTILSENGKINKETLLTFLHSSPLLAWTLKPNTGTSYPVIVDDDILNLPIPILSEKIQIDIKLKVQESYNFRKKTKYLLESVKKAIETAIEKNEKAAIGWLEKKIGEFDADRL